MGLCNVEGNGGAGSEDFIADASNGNDISKLDVFIPSKAKTVMVRIPLRVGGTVFIKDANDVTLDSVPNQTASAWEKQYAADTFNGKVRLQMNSSGWKIDGRVIVSF